MMNMKQQMNSFIRNTSFLILLFAAFDSDTMLQSPLYKSLQNLSKPHPLIHKQKKNSLKNFIPQDQGSDRFHIQYYNKVWNEADFQSLRT